MTDYFVIVSDRWGEPKRQGDLEKGDRVAKKVSHAHNSVRYRDFVERQAGSTQSKKATRKVKAYTDLDGNELTDYQIDKLFQEYLDDNFWPVIEVWDGLYEYGASDLKEVAPTDYRIALSEWIDSMVEDGFFSDDDDSYYAKRSKKTAKPAVRKKKAENYLTDYWDSNGVQLTRGELETIFDELMDDVYNHVVYVTPFDSELGSSALKDIDPILYRIAVGEYADQQVEDGGLWDEQTFGQEDATWELVDRGVPEDDAHDAVRSWLTLSDAVTESALNEMADDYFEQLREASKEASLKKAQYRKPKVSRRNKMGQDLSMPAPNSTVTELAETALLAWESRHQKGMHWWRVLEATIDQLKESYPEVVREYYVDYGYGKYEELWVSTFARILNRN